MPFLNTAELEKLGKRVTSFSLGEDLKKGIARLSEERILLIDTSTADTADPTRACIHGLSRRGVAILIHAYPLEINDAIENAPSFKGLACCVINPTQC